MDGDIPDLPKFIEIKKKHGAMLLVDEAHSAGVIGKTGRGIGEYYDVNRADCGHVDGHAVEVVRELRRLHRGLTRARRVPQVHDAWVCVLGRHQPPNAAAALAATAQILAHPERVKKAQDNAKFFLKLLNDRGINTGMSKDSAVVPGHHRQLGARAAALRRAQRQGRQRAAHSVPGR